MRLTLWLTVAAIVLPLLALVGKLLFSTLRDFFGACESLFILDLSAALTGEERDAKPGKFVLALFVVFALIATVTTYYLVSRHLFGIAEPWRP